MIRGNSVLISSLCREYIASKTKEASLEVWWCTHPRLLALGRGCRSICSSRQTQATWNGVSKTHKIKSTEVEMGFTNYVAAGSFGALFNMILTASVIPFAWTFFFPSPELELRPELCILNKQCCTSEIYPRTTVFVMRDFSRNEYWGFCLFACFLNVISESDNCETAPWYENISFYNLGVGQYLSVFLMQSQDWRLLLQTYLQDLPSS